MFSTLSITRDPGIEHSRLLKNVNLSAKVLKDVIDTLKQSSEVDIRDNCYYPMAETEAIR